MFLAFNFVLLSKRYLKCENYEITPILTGILWWQLSTGGSDFTQLSNDHLSFGAFHWHLSWNSSTVCSKSEWGFSILSKDSPIWDGNFWPYQLFQTKKKKRLQMSAEVYCTCKAISPVLTGENLLFLTQFQQLQTSKVLYMSSSFWLLGVESCDFSHAEKERTACKAEHIHKMTTIFT